MLIYGVFFTPQTFFGKKLNFNTKNDEKGSEKRIEESKITICDA